MKLRMYDEIKDIAREKGCLSLLLKNLPGWLMEASQNGMEEKIMTNLVVMKNEQVVTSSLQVAENFEKEHRHVLRDLDNLKGVVQNWADLFYEDEYTHTQNKQQYRVIYMKRDGFTVLAMGFTGKKAMQFKLKYIDAFNQMESHIKQQTDTSQLSPELQMFNLLGEALAKQERATKEIKQEVQEIRDVVALNTTDWRKNSNILINQVAKERGGFEAFRDVRSEIYGAVERRGKCLLNTRLLNKRRRMAEEGVNKSKRDKLSKLDVIGDDAKLVEIYLAVVKDFAINAGISL